MKIFNIPFECVYHGLEDAEDFRDLMRKSRTAKINDLIDLNVHPLIRKDPSYRLVDFVLHAINEGDLETSVAKFLRYSMQSYRRTGRGCGKRRRR